MTTTPQAALLSAQNPLLKRCYTMSESHLSGYRVVIGFERLEDAQDAHEYIAKLQATQAEPTIPGLTKEQFGYALHCAQAVDAATSEIARLRSENAALNERLDATQEPVQSIPPRLRVGDSHMESLIEAAIQGHAGTRDAMRWLVRQIANVDAEPVQAGELPPYIYGREAGPNEKVWTEQAVRAALSARKPLTDEQRGKAYREVRDRLKLQMDYQSFSLGCDCTERAHGIGLEVKP